MTTRRGFLGALLAAAAAPAIVRAGILMPVKPAIVMPPVLYTGEIGAIDDFRFIESIGPEPANLEVLERYRRMVDRHCGLTVAMVERAAQAMKRQPVEEPVFIVHPTWADALRAEGVPVKPDPRRFAMKH